MTTLLQNGSDVDLRDNQGKTALHWAVWFENLEGVNELISYGADINIEDNNGFVPIKYTLKAMDLVYTSLLYHTMKLDLADLFLSSANKKIITVAVKKNLHEINVSYIK